MMIKSFSFPNMLGNSSVIILEGHEATASNIKLLLETAKKSLLGDPYFGADVLKYMFEQNSTILYDRLIDSVYIALRQFVPQLQLNRKNISVTGEKDKVIISIAATNVLDYTNDLYNISITGSEIATR